MTTMASMMPVRFDIGRVVRRTFGAIGGDLKTYGSLALIFGVFPAAAMGALESTMTFGVASHPAMSAPNILAHPALSALTGLISLFVWIVTWIFLSIGSAATIFCATGQFKGRSPSLAEAVAGGSPHWWRIMLVNVLMGLGIVFGFVLLLVPGFMLMVRWLVAIPAQVIEGTGARASLGRSAVLTKGRRWPIFGLLCIYAIAVSIVQRTLLSAFGGPLTMFTLGAHAAAINPVTAMVIMPLFQIALFPINYVGLAAVYVELGGGWTSEAVADVFS